MHTPAATVEGERVRTQSTRAPHRVFHVDDLTHEGDLIRLAAIHFAPLFPLLLRCDDLFDRHGQHAALAGPLLSACTRTHCSVSAQRPATTSAHGGEAETRARHRGKTQTRAHRTAGVGILLRR